MSLQGGPPGGRQLIVTLSSQGVLAPAQRAMRNSFETIAIALQALQTCDFSKPPELPGAVVKLSFSSRDVESDVDRRARHERWLLAKGFQDVAKGIRESLEEAFVYSLLAGRHGEQSTQGALEAWISDQRGVANQLSFPVLLARVNDKLTARLQFEAEFQSLQNVRNCLEHRDGIVGEKDVGGGTGLDLVLPQMSVVVRSGGREEPFTPGIRVEAGGEVVSISTTMRRSFALGQRIDLTPAEFHDIAFASFFFCSDLASKLPPIPPR